MDFIMQARAVYHGIMAVQVNLCQKLLFLHQLNQNMIKDYSWNYHENYKRRTWAEHAQNMLTII